MRTVGTNNEMEIKRDICDVDETPSKRQKINRENKLQCLQTFNRQIVDLPPEVKQRLFSYVSVRDLKNLKLTSSSMNKDIMSLDGRFRNFVIRSSENIPSIIYTKTFVVSIDRRFRGDETKLLHWLQFHSSKISGLNLVVRTPSAVSFLNVIKSTTETLQELSINYSLLYTHREHVQIQSLSLFEMPVIGEKFSKLKKLHLCGELRKNLTEVFEACAETLTHLLLEDIDFTNVTPMKTKFKTLQCVEIVRCDLKLSQCVNLISESVQGLHLEGNCFVDMDSHHPTLSAICDLTLGAQLDCDWWLQRVRQTLKTLHMDHVETDWIDNFNHDLPVLKNLKIETNVFTNTNLSCDRLNSLLGRCPNLETLYLGDTQANERARVPGLKHLIVCDSSATWSPGVNKLLDSCKSSLQFLALVYTDLDLLDHVAVDGKLANLKKLCINSHDERKKKRLRESLLASENTEFCIIKNSLQLKDIWRNFKKM